MQQMGCKQHLANLSYSNTQHVAVYYTATALGVGNFTQVSASCLIPFIDWQLNIIILFTLSFTFAVNDASNCNLS